MVHDIMGQFLAAGERDNIFTGKVDIFDEPVLRPAETSSTG